MLINYVNYACRKGFNLSKQSILLISRESGYAYLVNPTKNVKSIFAKRVNESKHESSGHKKFRVYRLSRLYPGLYKIKIFGGNFNTIVASLCKDRIKYKISFLIDT